RGGGARAARPTADRGRLAATGLYAHGRQGDVAAVSAGLRPVRPCGSRGCGAGRLPDSARQPALSGAVHHSSRWPLVSRSGAIRAGAVHAGTLRSAAELCVDTVRGRAAGVHWSGVCHHGDGPGRLHDHAAGTIVARARTGRPGAVALVFAAAQGRLADDRSASRGGCIGGSSLIFHRAPLPNSLLIRAWLSTLPKSYRGGNSFLPNERLKLTGAAILVFRASMCLQAAPATWPSDRYHSHASLPATKIVSVGTPSSEDTSCPCE